MLLRCQMKGYWYVFGIDGKRRLTPISQYQNYKNRWLYSKNLGRSSPPPPLVDFFTKNGSGRRGLQQTITSCFMSYFLIPLQCWADKKSLNKVNAKSLSTLRQKIRKYNKEFEDQVTEYREVNDFMALF